MEEVVSRYRYVYKYRALPLLSKDVASKLLELVNGSCTTSSIDLGFSRTEVCRYGDEIVFNRRTSTTIDVLRILVEEGKDDAVYAIVEGEPLEIATYSSVEGGFYRLKYLGFGIPTTLEINGIHMHRIRGVDPYRDAELKIRSLGKIRGTVLDTCMGLGYTAIQALRLGASRVITVEISSTVISFAEINPWSKPLEDPRITVLHVDILDLAPQLPSNAFDAVIHDPPRISIAGELYSTELYRELFRVLKPGAKLFHYTGEPGKHGGPSYLKGIKERLQKVGFIVARWDPQALGYVAYKPR